MFRYKKLTFSGIFPSFIIKSLSSGAPTCTSINMANQVAFARVPESRGDGDESKTFQRSEKSDSC